MERILLKKRKNQHPSIHPCVILRILMLRNDGVAAVISRNISQRAPGASSEPFRREERCSQRRICTTSNRCWARPDPGRPPGNVAETLLRVASLQPLIGFPLSSTVNGADLTETLTPQGHDVQRSFFHLRRTAFRSKTAGLTHKLVCLVFWVFFGKVPTLCCHLDP